MSASATQGGHNYNPAAWSIVYY